MATSLRSSDQQSAADHADAADAPLREYVRTKQSVGELLRELHECAVRSTPWLSERAHRLVARLAEDRFQLVVVGQFKRGKSSLMNAIVGRPLLPTGTIPVTSVVTSLRYGSRTRVVIRRAGRVLEEEVSVEALAEFVTERGNPDNRKQVVSAQVEVPVPFLRRGLRFIDTPGIGSAYERNTATTLAFMPEADAAIFVTGADAPLSQSELEFLDAVRQHVSKIFFVLNKIDQVALPDREEVISYTSRVLAQRLGVDAITMFPMSASQALGANGAEPGPREDSGLLSFEAALATFLDHERRTVFLVSLLDRGIRLLEEMQFTRQLRSAVADTPAADDPRAAMRQRYEDQDQQRRAAVTRARARVDAWLQSVLNPALERFAIETREGLLAGLATVTKARPTKGTVPEAAVDWINTEIQRRAIAWLGEMGERVNHCVEELAGETLPTIEHLIRNTIQLAASAYGVRPEPLAERLPDDSTGLFHWERLIFEPPTFIPTLKGAPESPAGVARALAARLMPHRLSQDIPRLVDSAMNVCREMVVVFLQECVAAMDAASANVLDAERARIGQAIQPKETQTASSIDDASGLLESLLSRLAAVRQALVTGELPSSTSIEAARPMRVHPPAPSSHSGSGATPSRKVVTGTCVICAAMSDAVYDFLCHHQYAITVDRAVQQEFVATRGLCPTHTWHLEQLASPRGLADSYPLLLDDAAARLESAIGLPIAGMRMAVDTLIGSASMCPGCLTTERAQQAAAETLIRALAESPSRLGRQWVCLKHLRLLLAALDEARAEGLIREQVRRLKDVAESMREYVLKMDARRRELITDEEVRAYRVGLVLLSGERYLVVTAPEE